VVKDVTVVVPLVEVIVEVPVVVVAGHNLAYIAFEIVDITNQ